VVLREPDYHQLVADRQPPDSPGDLRAGEPQRMARSRQVPGTARKPVLRRVPAQQQSGAGSSQRLSRNPPGPPRCMPRDPGVPRLRNQQRGEVRRLGRVLRKGASPDQAPEAS
jgi:hypothetical protein